MMFLAQRGFRMIAVVTVRGYSNLQGNRTVGITENRRRN